MSKNSELVRLFMSETFRTYKGDLGKYALPEFVFKSTRFGELDFDHYVKYASEYYREEKVDIKWIHSTDDINFGVAYEVMDNNVVHKFGILAVTVSSGLVSKVME